MSYGKVIIGSDAGWQEKIDKGVISQKPTKRLCLFCGTMLDSSETVACNKCWRDRSE